MVDPDLELHVREGGGGGKGSLHFFQGSALFYPGPPRSTSSACIVCNSTAMNEFLKSVP